MSTAYLTHPRHREHTMEGHVENAARLDVIGRVLDENKMFERLICLQPTPADDGQLLRVHTRDYLNTLEWTSRRRDAIWFGADTYALPDSYDVARLGVGAALRAVDAVMHGEAQNALVTIRPPGHHALPDTAMGFCLLANTALAAKHAQAVYGVERILIVDYDLHHGNGTQDIFYDDPDVLYTSTHQSPLFPGTGMASEIGRGVGQGTTLNIPLRAGYGDEAFARIYERILWPAVKRFEPQLILVSAGYDAHWQDPLGSMSLTLSGYAHLSRALIRMAEAFSEGRIIFILEGGYNLHAVAYGVLNTAFALLGDETISDPLGPVGGPKALRLAQLPPIDLLLDGIAALHRLES